MNALDADGSELLRREIMDEASRQKFEILRRAREAADQSVAAAEQAAAQLLEEKLAWARAEAQRRADAMLAAALVESTRMRSARTEDLLQGFYDKALEQLRSRNGAAGREVIVALTTEALTRMAGDAFVLRLSTHDLAALGGGLSEEIRQRAAQPLLNLEVSEDPSAANGDWILQDREGRQLWELGLETRLERLWPQLRRQVAVHAQLTASDQPATGQP